MTDSILFLFSGLEAIFVKINSFGFDFFGYTLGIFDIFIAFICLAMILSLFWKGGRG